MTKKHTTTTTTTCNMTRLVIYESHVFGIFIYPTVPSTDPMYSARRSSNEIHMQSMFPHCLQASRGLNHENTFAWFRIRRSHPHLSWNNSD